MPAFTAPLFTPSTVQIPILHHIPPHDCVANPDWDRSGTPAITSRDRMETISLKSALCGAGFSVCL